MWLLGVTGRCPPAAPVANEAASQKARVPVSGKIRSEEPMANTAGAGGVPGHLTENSSSFFPAANASRSHCGRLPRPTQVLPFSSL